MFDPSRRLTSIRRLKSTAVTLAVLLAVSNTATAGPPLICHPFDAGSAALLPWGQGRDWNTPDRSYDVERLTADTLRLLSPDAPVLARMENLRRATIYASKDQRIAAELLAAVLAKALSAAAERPRDPLAWFDAGYVLESYRQASVIPRRGGGSSAQRYSPPIASQPEIDGLRFVEKALELAGPSPEMEFAASLMKEGSAADAHRQRAVAGARPGSLLAKNLAR
jgi:hypothetical protein